MEELFKSRRVRITVVGLVVWAAARFGLQLDAAAVDQILDLAMVLVASYGATGWGKERVAEAAKTGGTITSLEVTTTTMPPPIASGAPAPVLEALRRPPPTGRDLSEASKLREEARTRTPPSGAPPLPVPPRDRDG